MKKIFSNKKGFTLIELIVTILIVAIIVIGGFYALTQIMVGRVKLAEKINLEKETYFFTEKLFQMIKEGGTIDYEQYFEVRALSERENWNGKFKENGEFKNPLFFGNFDSESGNLGHGMLNEYFCSEVIGSNGCYKEGKRIYFSYWDNNYVPNLFENNEILHTTYGAYARNYIDYGKIDKINNLKLKCEHSLDKDCLIGNDDDKFLGNGPTAFDYDNITFQKSLYLINSKGDERTFFRYIVEKDPEGIAIGKTCIKDLNTGLLEGEGCRGRIEFVKLIGKDLRSVGTNYVEFIEKSKKNEFKYDGIIDTWFIHPDFTEVVEDDNWEIPKMYIATDELEINGKTAWKPVFSDSISVKDVKFEAYPNKDPNLAFADKDVQIAPYVRISMTVTPSWKVRKKLVGETPEIKISTTIALSEFYN